MASIDPRYRLRAAVTSCSGVYSVSEAELEFFLTPERDVEVSKKLLHETGRGVADTKSPFAYLFERIA